jgi:hypothetical protein
VMNLSRGWKNTPILYFDEREKRPSGVQDNAPGQISQESMLTLSTRVVLCCDTLLVQVEFACKANGCLSRRPTAFMRQMIVVIRCRARNSCFPTSVDHIHMRATRKWR